MKVYRDCINGLAPFDDPAFFTIFDASQNVVKTLTVSILSVTTVPPTNNSICAPAFFGNACVEEAIYETTVTLTPSAGGYDIVYQRCCRNGTILNLINPDEVGSTYTEHIPGPEMVVTNNSPRFTNRPPTYICSGLNINFDHVATDPDGDQLVYSLCSPFNGLDVCCPLISNPGFTNTCNNSPPICPNTNPPPPYLSVPFSAPYSASYPLSSSPAININASTGLLSGAPNLLGQWVVGVCVSEYRSGVLIGTHYRDFQFNVIACPNLLEARVVAQTKTNDGRGTGYCNGYEVTFKDASINATSWHWDFGDPSTLADTSNLKNPLYTFTQKGTYTITLIANPGSPCADTTTSIFSINPLLRPSFLIPNGQCLSNNRFNFIGGGLFDGTGTFNWIFGPNANPSSANTLTVNNVVFNAAGSYPITFSVTENGCSADTTKIIDIYQDPLASIGSFDGNGCDPFTITIPNTSMSSGNTNYTWSFSDGTTSDLKTPTHTFSPAGIYSASLTINTTNNCIGSSSVSAVNSITVNPTPIAGFTATPMVTSIFNPEINFFNTSISPNIISWFYDFGDGGSSNSVNPIYSYGNWGEYTVTQTIVNNFGCPNKAQLLIRILPEHRFWVPNAFTPKNEDGLNDEFKPVAIGVRNYSFTIFDRWGSIIFKTNDPNAGWNGTYKGKPCQLDVYVWKCEFTNIVLSKDESYVGHVTLLK
ncbi:MAG: PKD domain-containing protein [Bacteroidota bacterium]